VARCRGSMPWLTPARIRLRICTIRRGSGMVRAHALRGRGVLRTV